MPSELDVSRALAPLVQVTPTGKEILRDISLGMYLGAKIGVLGANGSGKSSLMRILAGVDKAFDGDYHLENGIKIGYLEQVSRPSCCTPCGTPVATSSRPGAVVHRRTRVLLRNCVTVLPLRFCASLLQLNKGRSENGSVNGSDIGAEGQHMT